MRTQCPKCKSETTQNIETAYRHELKSTVGKVEGTTISLDGDIAVTEGNFSGYEVSAFGQYLNPPNPPEDPKIVPGTLTVFGILFCVVFIPLCIAGWINQDGDFIWVLGTLVLTITLIAICTLHYRRFIDERRTLTARRTIFRINYDNWKKNWVCRSCSTVFVPK